MANLLSVLSLSGCTQICVARGSVSWGSKDNDAAGELQLWCHERDNDYYLYASNTAGHDLSNKTFVNEEKKSKENGNKESRRDPVPTSTVKGHDRGSLSVGQWVAVAYNEGFFIGKITAINMRVLDETVEEIDVNFLTKTTKGNYKWPKRKDTHIVSTTYIFFSTPTVNEDGKNFVVNNED
ncbi:unnamed protein product, partial [Porites lobata]